MVNLDEYKELFLSESRENLDRMNQALLELEKLPTDAESMQDLFRASHTIKGMAATMGYDPLTHLAHGLESLLDGYRRQKIAPGPSIIDLAFRTCDAVAAQLADLEAGRDPREDKDLLATLAAAKDGAVGGAAGAPAHEEATAAGAGGTSAEMQEYRQMFVSEARENLQAVNTALLNLEKAPADPAPLAEFFRAAHTIKGMSATMGYDAIQRITHILESVLDRYRRQKVPLEQPVVDISFEAVDLLTGLIEQLAASGAIPEPPALGGLVARLEAVRAAGAAGLTVTPEMVRPQVAGAATGGSALRPVTSVGAGPGHGATDGATAVAAMPSAPAAPSGPPMLATGVDEAKAQAGSIRISTESLENLLNLVGELTINKSRLLQLSGKLRSSDLDETSSHIDRLTRDLQDEVLKMRMVPARYIFNRFPRMVRDLSKSSGKLVEFVVEGWDIELDRTVLDEVSEPLVHLLRNSIDHAIEPPDVRERAGKPRIGTIQLIAQREKSNVAIIVEDDGKGIDPDVIRRKALEKGLADEARVAAMNDHEVIQFIFVPGFSTAKQVTEISGRGVGMDVVRTKVESLGGSVEFESTKGVGTRFVLKLPLTLAIIKALLVEVGAETYAVPIANIIETLQVPVRDLKSVRSSEVMLYRGIVLPIVRLRTLFSMPRAASEVHLTIVVVERADRRVGLAVDVLIGQQEVVIKTLGRVFQNIKGIAGATILGDGRVALIIDIGSLV